MYVCMYILNLFIGTSLEAQWLRFCLPMQGVQVQFLVREAKPHVPCSQKTKQKMEAILQQIQQSFKKMVLFKKAQKSLYYLPPMAFFT